MAELKAHPVELLVESLGLLAKPIFHLDYCRVLAEPNSRTGPTQGDCTPKGLDGLGLTQSCSGI